MTLPLNRVCGIRRPKKDYENILEKYQEVNSLAFPFWSAIARVDAGSAVHGANESGAVTANVEWPVP